MHLLGKNIYHMLFKLMFALSVKTWKRAMSLGAMWRGKIVFQHDFADVALKSSLKVLETNLNFSNMTGQMALGKIFWGQ